MCRKMLRPGTWMIHAGSVVGFAPEFVHAWSRLTLMSSSRSALVVQNQPRPRLVLAGFGLNSLVLSVRARCEPAHRLASVSAGCELAAASKVRTLLLTSNTWIHVHIPIFAPRITEQSVFLQSNWFEAVSRRKHQVENAESHLLPWCVLAPWTLMLRLLSVHSGKHALPPTSSVDLLPSACFFLDVCYSFILDFSPAARTHGFWSGNCCCGKSPRVASSLSITKFLRWWSMAVCHQPKRSVVVNCTGCTARTLQNDCWIGLFCFWASSIQLWSTEVAGALRSSVGSDGSILDQWIHNLLLLCAPTSCV